MKNITPYLAAFMFILLVSTTGCLATQQAGGQPSFPPAFPTAGGVSPTLPNGMGIPTFQAPTEPVTPLFVGSAPRLPGYLMHRLLVRSSYWIAVQVDGVFPMITDGRGRPLVQPRPINNEGMIVQAQLLPPGENSLEFGLAEDGKHTATVYCILPNGKVYGRGVVAFWLPSGPSFSSVLGDGDCTYDYNRRH